MQLCWASCSLACNHNSSFKPRSLLLYVVLSKLLPTFCFSFAFTSYLMDQWNCFFSYLCLCFEELLRVDLFLHFDGTSWNIHLIYRQNVLNGWSQWAFVAVFIPKHQMLRMYFYKNTIYILSVVAVLLCHSVVLCLTLLFPLYKAEVKLFLFRFLTFCKNKIK